MYAASMAGPPPPNATVIAIGANSAWLLVLWAYFVDKHRTLKIVD
jgi:hypothetical protein